MRAADLILFPVRSSSLIAASPSGHSFSSASTRALFRMMYLVEIRMMDLMNPCICRCCVPHDGNAMVSHTCSMALHGGFDRLQESQESIAGFVVDCGLYEQHLGGGNALSRRNRLKTSLM